MTTVTKPAPLFTTELNERQVKLSEVFEQHPAGDKPDSFNMSKKEFYASLTTAGEDAEAYKAHESLARDVAHALHNVITNRAFAAIKAGSDGYTAKVQMGDNTNYEDTYKRSYTSTVNNPKTGEQSERTVYGSHNPSIRTKYASLKKQRNASTTLAADLFGS